MLSKVTDLVCLRVIPHNCRIIIGNEEQVFPITKCSGKCSGLFDTLLQYNPLLDLSFADHNNVTCICGADIVFFFNCDHLRIIIPVRKIGQITEVTVFIITGGRVVKLVPLCDDPVVIPGDAESWNCLSPPVILLRNCIDIIIQDKQRLSGNSEEGSDRGSRISEVGVTKCDCICNIWRLIVNAQIIFHKIILQQVICRPKFHAHGIQ